jgi:small subunit ribosomal protein S14
VARQALVVKATRPQKYKVRSYNRCRICGRARAYMRRFGICRHCFRRLAHRGEIPGVRKASW